MAMVLWLFLRVGGLAARARSLTAGHPAQSLVGGFSAALCGQLAAAILSAPTIGSLGFFLQLGCVVGGAARVSIDAHPIRAAMSRTWPVSHTLKNRTQ